MRRFAISVLLTLIIGSALVTHPKAYVLTGPKWATNTVTYYINPDNLYVSSADAINALRTAASNWTTQANPNMTLNYGGTTTGSALQLNYKNEVFFRNESAGGAGATTYWWGDSSGHFIDTDIIFYEASFAWFVGGAGCSGAGEYIEDVATHEFGHVQGLDHTSVPGATMTPYIDYCSLEGHTLEADDIAGIEALYPPSDGGMTRPTAPSQLSVSADAQSPSSSLQLAWTNNATNADGYRVDRSADGGNTFGQIAQLGPTAVTYASSNLAESATYFYRVNAYNGAGASSYTNTASGQTQANTSAPSTPSNPAPGAGATGVSTNQVLAWSSTNALRYDVYFGTTSPNVLVASDVTTTSINAATLSPGTTYFWMVVAKNNVGATSGATWSFTTKTATNRGRKK